jgi:hypothetical protein
MKTIYHKTKAGAIEERTLIGHNLNVPNELLWVKFKKETDGRYSSELHSTESFKGSDMKWEGVPNWNETQMMAIELYGARVVKSGVVLINNGYKNINEAMDDKNRLFTLAKQLIKSEKVKNF